MLLRNDSPQWLQIETENWGSKHSKMQRDRITQPTSRGWDEDTTDLFCSCIYNMKNCNTDFFPKVTGNIWVAFGKCGAKKEISLVKKGDRMMLCSHISLGRLDQEWQGTCTCTASPAKCSCLWKKTNNLELCFFNAHNNSIGQHSFSELKQHLFSCL